MKYYAEIKSVGKIVKRGTYQKATHPLQAIRKSRVQREHYIAYVVNEIGEMWVYSVRMRDGKYEDKILQKFNDVFNRTELEYIFSGNMNVSDKVR
jgi:hypothetical protein